MSFMEFDSAFEDKLAEGLAERFPPVEDAADPTGDPAEPSQEAPDGDPGTDDGDAGDDGQEAPQDESSDDDSSETPPVTPSPDDVFSLSDGRTISRAQAEAYLQFEQVMRNDPQLTQLINNYIEGKNAPQNSPSASQPPAPQNPPQIPQLSADDLELLDPTTRAIYEQNLAQQEAIARLNQYVSRHEESLVQQQLATQASFVNRAKLSFAEQHKLDAAQVDELEQVAANLNILPTLMQGKDPITGAISRPDPLAAVERALEIAYWQMPKYRDAEITRIETERKQDKQKKAKLQAVSGSSGSVPRRTPAPRNENERRSQMVESVRALMNGTGE